MTAKLVIPLIFALGTSTAVFAQDAQMDAGTGFSVNSLPFDWDDETVDAFFSDTETGTLHDEDEISDNWAGLSPERQDLVRQYCEDLNAEDTALDGAGQTMPAEDTAPGADGAAVETDTDLSASTDAGDAEEPGVVGETDTFGASDVDGTAPEIVELCEIVEDL